VALVVAAAAGRPPTPALYLRIRGARTTMERVIIIFIYLL